MRWLILVLLSGFGGSASADGVRVEPALAVVPANHLKFYLHFPRPMERGEAFRHLRLVALDAAGSELGEVPEPFREVELWDESFTRLTLWFHPGRQKPGVNLNLEIGPVLEEGGRYRLEISGAWRDEAGQPLGGTVFSHDFAAGPPDEARPDPKTWRIRRQGEELRVETGEDLDPASLRRRVSLIDAGGKVVPARVEPKAGGFRLVREGGWPSGSYRLRIDPRLEDLAGNSVARLFNVDLERDGGEGPGGEVVVPFDLPSP